MKRLHWRAIGTHGFLVSRGDEAPSTSPDSERVTAAQRGHEKLSGHRRWIQYARHDDFDANGLRNFLTVFCEPVCLASESPMLAKVLSDALVGIDVHLIDVEVNIAGGLPQFSVVGLPDATVRESRDQVRSALKNTGFHFSAEKITVNLAPAGIKKEGSGSTWLLPLGFSSRKK